MKSLDIDTEFYRRSNADLRSFSDDALLAHYRNFGIAEGRPASSRALREGFVEVLLQEPSILEIGPFLRPVVRGRHVRYFDVLDLEGLKGRAKKIGYKGEQPPRIDYVSPTGDLSIIDRSFAAVVSSHCIEHQPDLIRHLDEVGRILDPGGKYYLLIPDKRYCFDHFIGPSTIADVLDAHIAQREYHTARSVIEHRALTPHNDPMRHWRGDHVDAGFADTIAPRVQAAVAEYHRNAGSYIDVDAWQFTPESFRTIIDQLAALRLSPLSVDQVFETPYGRNEFTATLVKRQA